MTMVVDLFRTMREKSGLGRDVLLNTILGRIQAWQDFMSRARKELNPEEEVGLYGELVFLQTLLLEGVTPFVAVSSWVGSLRGVQDFTLGCGAVEVKTTIAVDGFPAKIGSLEQLDDSVRQPLYLCAIRLKPTLGGKTLPEFADDIRGLLASDSSALSEFDNRLLRAGLFEAHYESYRRHFSVTENSVLLVDEKFPRLVSSVVPEALRSVKYEIDLDQVTAVAVNPGEMFTQLGMA